MNQRDLSEKLEDLAILLEGIPYKTIEGDQTIIATVVQELHKLSTENYAPGNSLSWDAVKPKPTVKKKGGFVSKSGKRMPF